MASQAKPNRAKLKPNQPQMAELIQNHGEPSQTQTKSNPKRPSYAKPRRAKPSQSQISPKRWIQAKYCKPNKTQTESNPNEIQTKGSQTKPTNQRTKSKHKQTKQKQSQIKPERPGKAKPLPSK